MRASAVLWITEREWGLLALALFVYTLGMLFTGLEQRKGAALRRRLREGLRISTEAGDHHAPPN